MKHLRELRIKLGVKQNVVAKQIGLHQSNFANIELGTLKSKTIQDIRQATIYVLEPVCIAKIQGLENQILELKQLLETAKTYSNEA